MDFSVWQVEQQQTVEQTLVDLASLKVAQSVEAPKIVSEHDVVGLPMFKNWFRKNASRCEQWSRCWMFFSQTTHNETFLIGWVSEASVIAFFLTWNMSLKSCC